jgi:hypothetical protein
MIVAADGCYNSIIMHNGIKIQHKYLESINLNNSGYFSNPHHALAAWCRSQRQNACLVAFCVHQLLQFTPNHHK